MSWAQKRPKQHSESDQQHQIINSSQKHFQNNPTNYSQLPQHLTDNRATKKFKSNYNTHQQDQADMLCESQCSASWKRRGDLLGNRINRGGVMRQLKRASGEIQNIELANNIIAMGQKLYLDAQYQERTNLQLRQMVVTLQRENQQLKVAHKYNNSGSQGQTKENEKNIKWKQSISRYEKLLRQSQQSRLQLLEQLQSVTRQNHEIRIQLSKGSMDNQTQNLIEQLTWQLQRQRQRNLELESELCDE